MIANYRIGLCSLFYSEILHYLYVIFGISGIFIGSIYAMVLEVK